MEIFRRPDSALFLAIALVLIASLACLYSVSHRPDGSIEKNYAAQQLMWLMLGMFVAMVVVWAGYEYWLDYAYIIFIANVVLLVIVLAAGSVRYGARRWIELGPFTLQPSEMCKISFLLALVKYAGDNRDRISSLSLFFGALVMCVVPMLLIIKQPDLGTALVFLPILFIVLFIAGIRFRYLLSVMLAGALSFPLLWHFLKPYQQKRILVFLNPDMDPLGAGYTIIQSKIAVGSGGIAGKGWFSGTQNQLNFLPERHTDFIFSVIGEEWGFLGAAFVVIVFLFLIKQVFNISDSTNDFKGKLLAAGVGAILWFQVFVNIAMTIGIMPVVGIPLPFISYGGSSFMTVAILIALAVSVNLRRKMF